MPLTLESIPNLIPGVTGRVLEPGAAGQREAVLVLPEQSQVKVLNEVGARIWTLIDGSRTLGEIARVICREYAVEEAQAREDVLAFAAVLQARGVISLASSGPRAG